MIRALLSACALLLAVSAAAADLSARGDVGTLMFLMDPPAAPLASSGRANPCVIVNVQENVHMGHGNTTTWEFRLQCRRDPFGRPLTLRFMRPLRTCTARGWWRPGTGADGNVELIGERCRYGR